MSGTNEAALELELHLSLTVSAHDKWKKPLSGLAAVTRLPHGLGHFSLLYQDGEWGACTSQNVNANETGPAAFPQPPAPFPQLAPDLDLCSVHLAGRPSSRGQGNCLQLTWEELLSSGWVNGLLIQQLGTRVIQVRCIDILLLRI